MVKYLCLDLNNRTRHLVVACIYKWAATNATECKLYCLGLDSQVAVLFLRQPPYQLKEVVVNIASDAVVALKHKDKFEKIAKQYLSADETIHVALKGNFKEYLICTNKRVYIIKQGFMTGHMLGGGLFKMDYGNITSVEIDMKIVNGYFEVSTGGVQNTRKSYWSQDANTSSSQSPNTVSISKLERADFERASSKIHELIHASKNSLSNDSSGELNQLEKLAELHDKGILTQQEFELKKKKLLDL